MIVESSDLMKTQGACSDCRGMDSPVSLHAPLVGVGYTRLRIGSLAGYKRTDYTFMQCSACGSVWVYYGKTTRVGSALFSGGSLAVLRWAKNL